MHSRDPYGPRLPASILRQSVQDKLDSLGMPVEEINYMPMRISHKKAEEVPTPGGSGRINEDLVALKNEMQKLASGMVLEIETGSEKAVRSAKMLITRASNQLGSRWQHWSVGTKVFARPAEAIRRRGRRRKEEA